jgi:adenylate cyclase
MLAFHRLGSFPSWSLRALLAGEVPEGSLRGSLVLIGSKAPSLRDGFRVPFAGPNPARSLRLSGVELHAHRLAALIALQEGRPMGMRAAPPWLNTTLLVAAVLAGVALGEGISRLRRSQITVLALATAMVVATAGSLASGWWFDAASPLAALAALAAWPVTFKPKLFYFLLLAMDGGQALSRRLRFGRDDGRKGSNAFRHPFRSKPLGRQPSQGG